MAARLIFVRACNISQADKRIWLDPVNMSASGYDPGNAEAIASSTVSPPEAKSTMM